MDNQAIGQDLAPHYYFFIRGLIRSQFHWHQFPTHFERIAQQHNLNSTAVFLDTPGNGRRFNESTPFSIAEMALDIEQQIRNYLAASKIDKNCKIHLVGISMGGMIAAELASKAEFNIDSIHIINSSFANLSPFWQRMQLPAFLNLVTNLKHVYKRESTILKWTSNNSNSIQLADQWAEEANRHPLSLRNAFAQLWAASHYFVCKNPNQNSFIYCGENDRLVSSKCSKKLAEYWQAPLNIEPQAGHDLSLDQPEWLAKNIILNSQRSI
jgi:pimeloyl-ACP methyl ester carboxylesterase